MLSSFIMLSFVVVFAIGIGLCLALCMYPYPLYVESDVRLMYIIIGVMNREIRTLLNRYSVIYISLNTSGLQAMKVRRCQGHCVTTATTAESRCSTH